MQNYNDAKFFLAFKQQPNSKVETKPYKCPFKGCIKRCANFGGLKNHYVRKHYIIQKNGSIEWDKIKTKIKPTARTGKKLPVKHKKKKNKKLDPDESRRKNAQAPVRQRFTVQEKLLYVKKFKQYRRAGRLKALQIKCKNKSNFPSYRRLQDWTKKESKLTKSIKKNDKNNKNKKKKNVVKKKK